MDLTPIGITHLPDSDQQKILAESATTEKDDVKPLEDSPNREKESERKNFRIVSLRTNISGVRYGPAEPTFQETAQLTDLIAKTLEREGQSDLLVTPEYSLYNTPDVAQPIEFIKTENGYQIQTGQAETTKAIQTICELAKLHKTAIVLSTIAEKEHLPCGEDVVHSTSLVIDAEGKIQQLRRKLTGTHSLMLSPEIAKTRSREFLNKIQSVLSGQEFIPTPEMSLGDKATAEARISAEKTLKPVTLMNRESKPLKLGVFICAERYFSPAESLLQNANVDILAIPVREGDDRYTDWSQTESLDQEDNVPLHKNMRRMYVETGIVAQNGTIVATDSGNNQAGVFPAKQEAWSNIEKTKFVVDTNYVAATL